MTYQIKYKKSVDKDFRKLPVKTRVKIVEKIQGLAEKPLQSNSTKLKGANDLYRLRQGKYRILYQVRNNELVILIIKVGHRKEAYRNY